MTTDSVEDQRVYPTGMTSDLVAANVRGLLAREGTSLAAFAERLGVPALWAQRRFGAARSVSISVDDLTVAAIGLGVGYDALLTHPNLQR